jgi:hypothetical protein
MCHLLNKGLVAVSIQDTCLHECANNGRSERIRTFNLSAPNGELYQIELHSEARCGVCS